MRVMDLIKYIDNGTCIYTNSTPIDKSNSLNYNKFVELNSLD